MLTDQSIMPYGKYHKTRTRMINVPADYLLWLFANNKCTQEVRDYIIDNKEALELEVKNKKS